MNLSPIVKLCVTTALLLLTTVPAGAQAPESSLTLNAYHCPAGYDQVGDCARLSGVVVDVAQDGQPLDRMTTRADEGATLDLLWGAFIELDIVGGVPAGTALEDTALDFDVVEGANAVTLVFVDQEMPPPPPSSYVSVVAWSCPTDYEEHVDVCTPLADVFVDVRQDGAPIGQLRTSSTGPATLDVQTGAFIELTVAGGVPERADLVSGLDLAFVATTGENPAMLVFVAQDDMPLPHSDTNALVVQASLCPAAYGGNDYVSDCVGEEGVTVTTTRDADGFSVTEATGSDGIVGFQGLGVGTYTVELGVPGDVADFLTFCGTPDGVEPRQLTTPDTNRIGVYLGPIEELTCTFYIVPVDARGEPTPMPGASDEHPIPAPVEADEDPAPAPAKSSPGVAVTTLPSTGTGNASPNGTGVGGLLLMVGATFLTVSAGTRLVRQRGA